MLLVGMSTDVTLLQGNSKYQKSLNINLVLIFKPSVNLVTLQTFLEFYPKVIKGWAKTKLKESWQCVL